MIVGLLFLQAVVFAILSVIVANNKNRDPAGWGIIGFLFGLFGFIAAVAVSEVEPTEESTSRRKKSQSSNTQDFNPDEHEKKCPMCAEYIKLEARRCKHCSYEFSDEQVERQIEEKRKEVKQKKESEQAPKSVEGILATHSFNAAGICKDCGSPWAYVQNNEYVCPS